MSIQSPDQALILVVDDEKNIRDSIGDILTLQGFEAITAKDGLEALSVLKRRKPDLIVADIMMPRMNGYQLFQRIRDFDAWDYIPFLFLSAKGEDVDIRFGKEMGADDYLRKPIDAEDLLAAIRGKLRRYEQLKQTASDISSPVNPTPVRKRQDYGLTHREIEVLAQLIKGKSNPEIAETLVIGVSTVKSHVGNILSKLAVENRVAAVSKALEEDLIQT
jgi:DNA-binding NarL/FixJ family response regulator